MSKLARRVAVALGCTLLGGSAAFAGPLVPTRPSQLVSAKDGTNTPCPFPSGPLNTPYLIDRMVGSDGSVVPFAIPEKQVFVITSFDFNFGGPVPDTTVFVQLTAYDAMGAGATLLQGTATTSGNQVGGGSVVAPSGIAVRRDKTLCVTGTAGATGGIVHGFFAKDR